MAGEGNHQADFRKMEEGLKALQEMVGKMIQESRATSSAIEQLTQESRPHIPNPAGVWCSNGGLGTAHPTRFCCVEFRFPTFDGSGLDGWLCKTEQFFEVDETPLDARIRLASIHLEGMALIWHRIFMRGKSYATVGWDEYVTALKIRFGPLIGMNDAVFAAMEPRRLLLPVPKAPVTFGSRLTSGINGEEKLLQNQLRTTSHEGFESDKH